MFLGRDGFIWWVGVVEDISDPELLGRAKVRIFGYHPKYVEQSASTGDTNNLVPTKDLPWATVVMTPNLPNFFGRLRLGEWVLGFFLDGVEAQEPAIIGYIPSTNTKLGGDETFGRYAQEVKTFSHLQHDNQYSFVTPGNNSLTLSDEPDKKEILIKTPVSSISILNNTIRKEIRMSHIPGCNLILADDGSLHLNASSPTGFAGTGTRLTDMGVDIKVEGPGGQYFLTHELNRLIANVFPPPPPPRGGGGCFIGNTLVTMWDGTRRRIDEVEVGDLVQSGIHCKPNKVMFVEKLIDTMLWKELYTPSGMHEPFATPNHILFVNKEWVAVDVDLYEWMPKARKIKDPITRPTEGDMVYNLWLDGDGKYFVNEYLTHSIMYDGSFMRRAWENKCLTHEQVMGLMHEFTTQGESMIYGSYLINKLVGMINQKHWIRLMSYIMLRDNKYIPRKCMIAFMKIAYTLMKLIKRRT